MRLKPESSPPSFAFALSRLSAGESSLPTARRPEDADRAVSGPPSGDSGWPQKFSANAT